MARKPTIEELRQQAQKGNVEFEIRRWYDGATTEELREIQQQGFISEARHWLDSMRPEKMFRDPYPAEGIEIWMKIQNGKIQIGERTLGQRLYVAQYFARKAGVDLQPIIEQMGLVDLVDDVMPEYVPEKDLK